MLSATDAAMVDSMLQGTLTDKVNDRETFMKGIDYSYYYEQEDAPEPNRKEDNA